MPESRRLLAFPAWPARWSTCDCGRGSMASGATTTARSLSHRSGLLQHDADRKTEAGWQQPAFSFDRHLQAYHRGDVACRTAAEDLTLRFVAERGLDLLSTTENVVNRRPVGSF